ncbi:MAG: hypothetical protein M3458_13520, partial [Acidobacteriota bacterium]|nr:hypothetical protein [Acidobacteriota bacterium]
MRNRLLIRCMLMVTLVCGVGVAAAIADTIRLKDGSVIRGQIVGFRDQQFTVLIGGGARGRRSQVTIYIEDVDTIEFGAGGASTPSPPSTSTPASTAGTDDNATYREPSRTPTLSSAPARTSADGDAPSTTGNTSRSTSTPAPTSTATSSTGGSPAFFQVPVRVRADSSSNGWTNSGLVVRRGQRLRINATGRVSLGQQRFSTPGGLPRINDEGKLMRNEPTGALIAVIGDDNDE